jgi:hypothetical protein
LKKSSFQGPLKSNFGQLLKIFLEFSNKKLVSPKGFNRSNISHSIGNKRSN